MECLRCSNKDESYFYKGHKGYYCRKCIPFKRILLNEEIEPYDYEVSIGADKYYFAYELTKYQQAASNKTLEHLMNGKDVLLHCVCGAGKTEIVVESISHYLKKGLKVCYAIARREVVIELEKRFASIFKDAKVAGVYGNHHDVLSSDLIVCTTHQLYRYHKTFDLLILDEVDAFPLSGNNTLMNISLNASKGRIIFSSATVNDFLKDYLKTRDYKEVNLYIRPSLKPLSEPIIVQRPKLILMIKLLLMLKKTKEQIIIFVSSKKEAINYYRLFKRFINCTYVYSDLTNRDQNISDFKNKKYQFIFSTTVLERGITIKGVSVIVLFFRKNAFSASALTQIIGRVGRGVGNDNGNAYILTNQLDKNIRECNDEILFANKKFKMSFM